MTATNTGPEHWRRLLAEGRNICMAPWLHMHVPAFGHAAPCCMAQGDFGDLPPGDTQRLRNSPQMNSLRATMLRDQPDPRCLNCTRAEALGFSSERKRFNREFAHHWQRLAETAPDGSIGEMQPVSWDLRLSNLCNFRCRMCFHGSSSKWHKDAIALGWTKSPKAVVRSFHDPAGFVCAHEADISTLEYVYFAGGEPMLMKEHWQILDLLLAHGREDVKLAYTTNLSKLTVGKHDVIASWNRFRQVSVSASVDGAAQRGELIRSGFSWPAFVANARRVRRDAPHVRITAQVTVSVMNVLHLPELHRRLTEEDVLPADAFSMHPLFVPEHYTVAILPRGLRREARQRIERHRLWIDDQVRQGTLGAEAARDLHREFSTVLNMLNDPYRPAAARAFRAISAALDALRGERMPEVFTELAPLFRRSPREWLGQLIRKWR